MTGLTLGLDIGTTSIGWFLVDEETGEIHGTGVRIFPEGVDRDTSGSEQSKNEQRRLARSSRRLTKRRARRRKQLKAILVESGLLPKCLLLPREDPSRVKWETEAFKQSDPYSLRKKALDEQLEPFEIGRAILHLSQRRGFLSNRKADRDQEKETQGMLGEISDLQNAIEATKSRTLGEYLVKLRDGDPKRFHTVRLRGRHTRRDMYQQELDTIWESQREFHPELLTDKLKATITDKIFFQREIKPPSPGLVGRCELEPRLARAPRADRRVQKMRLHQEVNNLRIIDLTSREERELSPEEREKLIKFLSKKKEATFDQLKKHLFEKHQNIMFNLERAGRKKLHGLPIDYAFGQGKKALIGKQWWDIDDNFKDWIVAAIIEDNEARLRDLLQQVGIDPELTIPLLEKTPLESGYASYSLKAIKKLLPFVEQGMPITSRDESIPSAYHHAGYTPPWKKKGEQVPFLNQPPELTNPIVRQALHEVRKVVNAILRELVYKEGHTLKTVRVELAREARGTAQQRADGIKKQRDNEKERNYAADEIRKYGAKVTGEAIERYRLWKEQEEQCIYSGRVITMQQLLGGEVDIDHILPYSRSLDNSQMNKVVCFRDVNAYKGNQLPKEWLAESDPEAYEQILQRARKLRYPKFQRFFQDNLDEGFSNRQIVDTSYISTQVRTFLETLGAEVETVKGIQTSQLRRLWGLDTILSELSNSPAWEQAQDLKPGEKNRLDHRHHAIDAAVVALSNRKRIHNVSNLAIKERYGDSSGNFTSSKTRNQLSKLVEPWDGFRNDVSNAIEEINVSFRVNRKASGQLHEDTIYGKTESEGVVVVRKPLEALTPSMIENIRDPAVKKIVLKRLAQHGISIGRGSAKIHKDVWIEPLYMDKAKTVPIKKVRFTKKDATVQPIRGESAFIKPGNTHHLCLFEYEDETGNTKRTACFVNMMEAMQRLREKKPVIQRTHPDIPSARFLFSLSGNEMLLVENEGKNELFRFVTAPSTTQQMEFRHHYAAGKSGGKIGKLTKYPNSLFALTVHKVTIDPIGRIRWAND
ncbi:type II CRISPR RNA-guided endonuclease Cas9 [Thalassoglobus sp.]|uniref:type II CRISPR RNA-guided endonuclease Cas9 n=1 Tax=Thalassoglobus sp. TaxID=2795869 RepID=UPI003AA95CA6